MSHSLFTFFELTNFHTKLTFQFFLSKLSIFITIMSLKTLNEMYKSSVSIPLQRDNSSRYPTGKISNFITCDRITNNTLCSKNRCECPIFLVKTSRAARTHQECSFLQQNLKILNEYLPLGRVS